MKSLQGALHDQNFHIFCNWKMYFFFFSAAPQIKITYISSLGWDSCTFSLKMQTGEDNPQHVRQMPPEACINEPIPWSIMDGLGTKQQRRYAEIRALTDIYLKDVTSSFLLFLFLFVRPDRSSRRKREDVWVGSLSADHLLQKSRQLQSHQDPIQPPREQGEFTLILCAASW